jgi:integrase
VLGPLAVQCGGRSPDDLAFGDGATYLPRPKSSTGWFQAAVRRAKVQKITPHDLRHTWASISISSGVNVLALSRMLGHQSAKITLDTSADLFDTDLDAIAGALDLKCAQSVPKPRPASAAGA